MCVCLLFGVCAVFFLVEISTCSFFTQVCENATKSIYIWFRSFKELLQSEMFNFRAAAAKLFFFFVRGWDGEDVEVLRIAEHAVKKQKHL